MISTPKLFGNCNRSEYYVIQMIDIHKHKIKYRIETLRNEYIEYTRFKIKISHQFPTPLSPILAIELGCHLTLNILIYSVTGVFLYLVSTTSTKQIMQSSKTSCQQAKERTTLRTQELFRMFLVIIENRVHAKWKAHVIIDLMSYMYC